MSSNPTRRVHVRITGGGSGGASSGTSGLGPAINTAGLNCYSGIEQTSDVYGRVSDLEDGLHFDSFAFPLVEMSEATDVPIDAIVWASPSINGQNYEFLWSGSQEESGSGSGSGGSGCIAISDFIMCTDDGAAIRPGNICLVNGRLVFTPT